MRDSYAVSNACGSVFFVSAQSVMAWHMKGGTVDGMDKKMLEALRYENRSFVSSHMQPACDGRSKISTEYCIHVRRAVCGT